MSNGIRTTNLERSFVIDELLGNVTQDGVEKTARLPLEALASQLAGTGPFILGNTVYALTKAALDAFTPPNENMGGVVLNDPNAANNGYYARSGGAWARGRGFPDSVVLWTQTGGTPNALQVSAAAGVDPASTVLALLVPTQSNSAGATVSINGGAPVPIYSATGAPLGAGELVGGMASLLAKVGSAWRLINSNSKLAFRKAWNSATGYVADDLVENGGSLWLALRPNTNVPPVEGADWTLFLPGVTVADGSLTPVKISPSSVEDFRTLFRSFHRDKVARIANQMATGVACRGGEWGDSTTVGVDVLNAANDYIATEPAPLKTQNFLQEYYQNANIFVENHGVSGTNSTAMLGSFSSEIATLAAAGGKFVIVNTCINDAQNSTPVDIDVFRSNLLAMERIVRGQGMAMIFKTGNPIVSGALFNGGYLGTIDKAERLKNYAEVIRNVCDQTGAILVDTYELTQKLQNYYRTQDLIPDGVHPTNEAAGLYRAIGQLVAGAFCYPQKGISRADEIITAGGTTTQVQPATNAIQATQTLSGVQLITTAASVAKAVRMLIKIDEPGLDVYLAYPIWGGGIASAGVNVDQVGVNSIGQLDAGNFGTRFIQQHELLVIKDAQPGLHMVAITAAPAAGSIGANYLRTRATKKNRGYKANAPFISKYELMVPKATLTVSNGSNAIHLFDEFPVSRLIDGIDIEFTATLQKAEAFVVHGLWAADNTSGIAIMGVGFGCAGGTGFATAYQANGDTNTATALNAVDTSLIERLWRVVILPGLNQSMNLFIDGSGYAAVPITKPYLGGLLGMRKSGNGDMTIKDLRRLVN